MVLCGDAADGKMNTLLANKRISRMTGRFHVLLLAAVSLAVSACASFGQLTPVVPGFNARLVPELSFDLDTCPILFFHGDADACSAMNDRGFNK